MMFGYTGGDISKNFSDLKTEDINTSEFNEIISVEIKVKNKKGQILTKTLTNPEAKKWHDWIVGVCQFAQVHGCNPAWEKLKWKLKLS